VNHNIKIKLISFYFLFFNVEINQEQKTLEIF
jgi:hypothetical protein